MCLWDRLRIHGCYHLWNPIGWVLNDDWVADVYRTYGMTYPGWKELR